MLQSEENEKKLLEKLAGKELSEREINEAKHNLLGALAWLLQMDKKYNPDRYENN